MLSTLRLASKHLNNPGSHALKIRMFASASPHGYKTVDGCTAVTHVAYGLSDAAFIFPITPSSPIAELAEQWSDLGVKNAFGDIVKVTQMQSEAGAAGALHGALVTGSLATTFTASQGLLLMIPNMYKISGELLPCVIHVAARAIASQALSIFGDHQDVMAARQTGFAFLCANTVQECQDMALVSHLATLRARVPFVHFFDGFRVSHNIEKAQLVPYADMKKLLDFESLHAHHARALNPMHPHVRGSNQNPDVYFQMLEASNSAYDQVPSIVLEEMEKLGKLTGRHYSLFDYSGAPDATDVIVVMGSGGSVVEETLPFLLGRGDKVGVLKPKLFRPWSAEHFLAALPHSVKRISVLDRTKEPGSLGEPLFLDVASTLKGDARGQTIDVIGGRWGLGQKDFTPGCVVSVFDNMRSSNPRKKFTVGIEDDVTNLSLSVTVEPEVTHPNMTECLIYGFGSDGTVGANKNAIKILGDNTDLFVQAYFAYGSQKAGGLTLSHLRFGPEQIKSYYHVSQADYVACHNNVYVDMYRMADKLKEGGVFCLNSPWTTVEDLDANLPESLKRTLFEKKAQLYNIDAFSIAENAGMGRMINVAMSAAFFKLSDVIEYEKAISLFKAAIKKSYSHRGEGVVAKNYKMVDETVDELKKIEIPESWGKYSRSVPLKTEVQFGNASDSAFVRDIQGNINLLRGDEIPVSILKDNALGGVMPMGTSAKEKRGVALEVPEVDMDKCTQCNYCAVSCPHAVIRPFLLSQAELDAAPASFDSRKAKGGSEVAGLNFRIQVSPYDCTGCAVCVNTCPDDALGMVPLAEIHTTSSANWEFGMGLTDRADRFDKFSLKGSQFQTPLMEFSGACAGCGETPYIKLVTQLFGNRMVIANATGCSSIYGAPFGSAPYTTLRDKTGPAWGNSLFEDAAEYGLGMSVTVALRRKALRTRVQELLMENTDAPISAELFAQLSEWNENWRDAKICDRLARSLPQLLAAEASSNDLVKEISTMSDLLPKISIWNIGGDGWAFDIGYGGLDHVLASGQDINVLVLDTEVYSNTGGQASKSSPVGSIAKFATGGRPNNKKSMADMAIAYGNVYVANCSMGANMQQTLKSLIEAEAYPGPSLVLAYSPCIEHKNVDGMSHTMQHMEVAANSGYYPLFRYNPLLKKEGKAPFILDTKKITADVSRVIESEMRYGAMKKRDVEKFEKNLENLRAWINERFEHLQQLSQIVPTGSSKTAIASAVSGESRPLTILYGSETGNTQELAYRTGELAKQRGFDVLIKELDEVPVETLGEHPNVLIMCSTCGEGDIPRNAQSFMEELEKASESKAVNLSHVNYAVFAMGDSSYHEFCKVGKDIDELLSRVGAQRSLAIGIGNDRDEDKFETGFEAWAPQFWTVQKAPEPAVSGPPESLFEIVSLNEDNVKAPYKAITAPCAVLASVDLCKRLTPSDYSRDIRHVQIALKNGQDLPYMLGDVLNLYPRNDSVRVRSFLTAFGEDPEEMVKLTPSAGANMDARKRAASLRPRTLEQVLTEVLDIFGRPNRGFYKTLARFAEDGSKAKTELELLAGDSVEGRKMYSDVTSESLTYGDIILKYMDEAKPSIEHLITVIPPVKPRLYSIASSPRFVGPNLVELVVVINEWKTPSGQIRRGTGTNYVQSLKNGDEVACTITSGTFKFPESPMTPMIMAGLGTGLAPFRAFVQERQWMKDQGLTTGPMWLFYGCRYRSKDYIFGDELEKYAADGVITELQPAFSRDTGKKVYVQNKIMDNHKRVYEDLVEKNGFFYLCGQAGQAELDIKEAIYQSMAKGLGVSRDEAVEKFEQLAEEGRYCPELY